MSKLKMLKMPKAPKVPAKPKQTASLETKQRWLQRVKDLKAKFQKQIEVVKKENAHRAKVNNESERLSKVISGVSKLEVFPRGFSVKSLRSSGSKRKKSKAKPAKKAAKKTAKKAAPKRKGSRRRK